MSTSESGETRFDRGLAAFPAFAGEGDVVRLLGSRCTACEAFAFPRRMVCLRCGGETVDATLSGRGVLHA